MRAPHMPMSSKRRLILRLSVVAACSFLVADTLNAFLAQRLAPPALQISLPRAATAPSQASVDLASLSEEIAQSGLFGAPPPGTTFSGAGGEGAGSGPPLDAGKKIQLMGTVMGEGLSALAVVQNLSTKRQVLYHLHEQIPDLGEIGEIHADSILIRNGAQAESLPLLTPKLPGIVATGTQAAPQAEPVRPSPAPVAAPKGASPLKPQRLVLERRVLAPTGEALADPARHVRFEAASPEDRTDGLRLMAYRPKGLMDSLGLRSGDLIRGFNGVPPGDQERFLKQLQRIVKEEHNFTLDIVRNGEKATFTYEIR
jgi:general secretion pathway protein C